MGSIHKGRRNRLGQSDVMIGCAGWKIPSQHASLFPSSGSHLARYAQHFTAVEINSSFYKPHRESTYERWAATVPDDFAFAVKMPKAMTHELRLEGVGSLLDAFLAQVRGLGGKLGPLLFQLPPSLAFNELSLRSFLGALRARFDGCAVCEPRHPSWFTVEADDLLTEFQTARVAADPAIVDAASAPGGWSGLRYFRLHGSPHVYHSEYGRDRVEELARQLVSSRKDHSLAWCVFDNTASGAAITDALALQACTRLGLVGSGKIRLRH